jgi:triacylglycerol lipase
MYRRLRLSASRQYQAALSRKRQDIVDEPMTIAKLRSPIVLVHGLFGFQRLELAGATIASYFRGIPELLQPAGNRVLIPALPPTGGVDARAKALKDYISAHAGTEPVHIIAHSMGGLDSRYMISQLDMAPRVLTLTTLGTPHRGTSFADWGVSRLERIIKPFLEVVGMPTQAFYDLTRPRCAEFNDKVKDAPNVRYFSVAGKHDGHFAHLEWLLPFGIIHKEEGDNDGLVSVASATYGEHCEIWDDDHHGLINWYHPVKHMRGILRDPAERYGAILRRLADMGY